MVYWLTPDGYQDNSYVRITIKPFLFGRLISIKKPSIKEKSWLSSFAEMSTQTCNIIPPPFLLWSNQKGVS